MYSSSNVYSPVNNFNQLELSAESIQVNPMTGTPLQSNSVIPSTPLSTIPTLNPASPSFSSVATSSIPGLGTIFKPKSTSLPTQGVVVSSPGGLAASYHHPTKGMYRPSAAKEDHDVYASKDMGGREYFRMGLGGDPASMGCACHRRRDVSIADVGPHNGFTFVLWMVLTAVFFVFASYLIQGLATQNSINLTNPAISGAGVGVTLLVMILFFCMNKKRVLGIY